MAGPYAPSVPALETSQHKINDTLTATSIKHKPTIHFKWSLDYLQFVSFRVGDNRVAHVFAFFHVFKHFEHFGDPCRVTSQLRDLKQRDQCVNEQKMIRGCIPSLAHNEFGYYEHPTITDLLIDIDA